MHSQQNNKYTEMHGQQNDKYTEMHGQQNDKIREVRSMPRKMGGRLEEDGSE